MPEVGIKSCTFSLYYKSKTTGNMAYVGERRLYFPGASEDISAPLNGQGTFASAAHSVGYLVSSGASVPWLGGLKNDAGYFICDTTISPFTLVGVQNYLGWDMQQYYNSDIDLVFRLPDLGDHVKREIVLETTFGANTQFEKTYGCRYHLYKDDVLVTTLHGTSAMSRVGTSGGWEYPITVHQYGHGFPWYFDFNGTEVVSFVNISASYSRKNSASAMPTGNDMGAITGSLEITSDTSTAHYFKTFLTVDDGGGESHVYTGDDLDEDNPFIGGGTTEDKKPNPNFIGDDDGTNIIGDTPLTDELPDETEMGASASGFATLFTPTKTQLKNLANLMWNHTFLETIRNLVENVSDLFVSLAMVPFVVPAGATKTVTWLGLDSGVSLTLASKQFLEFPMGSISLGGSDNKAFAFDSCLDYSPFSHLGIYLPFIGYRDLDIDECRNTSIGLTYRIDILSGECVAIINVAGRDVYEFTGNCLSQIPISNENMQSLVSDAVNVGLAVAGFQAASGVAAAENAAAGVASKSELGDLRHAHAAAHMTHSDSQLASATANAMMGMKPKITKTGSVSGASAMMAVRQPYLMLTTPRQAVPENYEKYCGFPANLTGRLGDFSGYTVVEDIRLNNLVATSAEVAEIYKLLKQGVIV